MKKFTAIFVAVILISANFVMAYAADVYTCQTCNRKFNTLDEYNSCVDKHISDSIDNSAQELHKCATCGKLYTDLGLYNNCIDSHFNNVNYHYDKYVGLTIPELLAELVNIFNKTGTMETVQDLVDKLFEITSKTIDEKSFSYTLSDLELELESLDLDMDCFSDIKGILNKLKEKLMCNEDTKESTVAEVTQAEPPADTGSSAGVGFLAIAAISVTVPAACVTISKKK